MKAFPLAVVGILTAVCMVAGSPAVNAADTIPRWDIAEICASSTLGNRCPKVESQHRRAVFERWQVVPVAERTACEATVVSSGQRSYQALLTCLEAHQLRAIEKTPKSSVAPTGGNRDRVV